MPRDHTYTSYRKTCSCRATASGPRAIVKDLTQTYGEQGSSAIIRWDAVVVEMTWVPLACDNCDKEWELVEPPVPGGGV